MPKAQLVKVVRVVRDAWLVIGVALLLLLGIEAAYRLQGLGRGMLSASGGEAAGPYAGQRWYPEYRKEFDLAVDRGMAWRPYVYAGERPFRGRYLNIDSAGHRRTVEEYSARPPLRDVFVYGGSTLWGTGQRDSMTIPSRLAADLAARGVADVRVTNMGMSGRVLTHEVIDLMLELRAGARPAVVVFYDGINDVGAAVQNGRAGIPENEVNRARDFDNGRLLYSWRTDLLTEVHVALRLGALAAGRLQFVKALRSLVRPAADGRTVPDDSISADVEQTYLRTVEWVEGLARQFGFTAIYFWQPTLHSTMKPLTPYERGLAASYRHTSFGRQLVAVHRAVPARLRPAAEALVPGRFVDLSALFTRDTETVYIDDIGHTTETASATIASAMAPSLARVLQRAPGAGRAR